MKYKIEKQIESYLNGDYPFALLINGKWGSGKTYYLTKALHPYYKNFKTKGKVFYISANGVKNIDELKKQILFNNINLNSKKQKNSMTNTFTSLISSVAGNYGIKLEDLATVDKEDILIIDDLERRNSELSIQDIFGFVSTTFTEQNEIKVILVADEEKLLEGLSDEKEKDNYRTIKEKTIYRTIDFDEDLSDLLKGLIDNKEDGEFKKFLQEKSDFILNRCNVYNETNLRTIGFYLNSFEILFREFGGEIKKDTDNIILNTLLLLSILYKKGIQFFDQNTKELKSSYKLKSFIERLTLIKPNAEPVQILEFGQTTDQEYFTFNEYLELSSNLYDHFPALFELTDKGVLLKEQFLIEYGQFIKYYDKNLPWVSELHKFKDHRNFIDSEFNECLNNITNHIITNKYSVNELHYIAYLFEQYQNIGIIGEFDVSSFYKNIEESMKNRKDTALDNDFLFDDSKTKGFSQNFNDLTKLIDKFRKNILLDIHKTKIPNYLDEYFRTGEFNEQDFIVFLNSASYNDIIIFSHYIIRSSKHIDTFCNDLIKIIYSFYYLNTNLDQNIELIKTCLQENIKDLRIPKFRIEKKLDGIQRF